VPLARGPSRSRNTESILSEARRLISKGFKEIVLIGICLGAWGKDLSPRRNLSYLLKHVIELGGNFRIRLSSIEPKYIDSQLVAVVKSSSKLCNHLHIPLQSGDDKILKMMNRHYTAARYIDIIDMVRTEIPTASITTDILVSFPGETEANFNNTYRVIERVRPSRVHIFSYSKREGTRAASLGKEIPEDVVKKRVSRIRDLALTISYRYRKDFLKKQTEVLIEHERDRQSGLLKGYDDKYIRVLLNGDDSYKSEITPVKIHKVEADYTLGRII
jgi:threonylcarbamoyladenosine tRNA methylthiotransferase MtaB